MTMCTYVNVKVVQLEDLGGRLLVSDEPEDLKIATVPFHCPHLFRDFHMTKKRQQKL